MKVKGFISAFLALAVSTGLAVTAMADGANVSSTNDEGIVVTADADMKIKTVVADFDVNGRLVSAFTKLVDTVKGDNTYTYADLGVSGIGAQRKVMLWKSEADSIEPVDGAVAAAEAATDITGYMTACVDYVEIGTDEVYIYFDASSRDEGELVINAGKTCNVILDGEPVSIEEIEAGDVLTIKCGEDEWLEDMDAYDIIVTRNTASVKVTSVEKNEDGVLICSDGVSEYVCEPSIKYLIEVGANNLMYFDTFGRIVYAEEIIDYGNVGVITDLYNTADGYKVKVSKASGGTDRYVISEAVYNELYDILYKMEGEMYAVKNRVISYNITENGEFEFTEKLRGKGGNVMVYSPETSAELRNSKAIMADEDDYVDVIYPEMLIEGKKYMVWYFGANAGNTYELAVVQAVQEIESKNSMAVFVKTSTEETADGSFDAIHAYVGSELQTLLVDTEFDLTPGDAFFYLKDADGIVTTILPVFNGNLPNTYTELYNNSLDSNFDLLNLEAVQTIEASDEDVLKDDTLVFGVIVNYGSGWIDVATKDTVTDVTAIDVDRNTKSYDIADAAVIHKYDYDYSRAKDRISASSAAALGSATFPKAAYVDDSEEVLNLRSDVLLSENNANYGRAKFVVLKIVDREITEALVIVPSSTKE